MSKKKSSGIGASNYCSKKNRHAAKDTMPLFMPDEVPVNKTEKSEKKHPISMEHYRWQRNANDIDYTPE